MSADIAGPQHMQQFETNNDGNTALSEGMSPAMSHLAVGLLFCASLISRTFSHFDGTNPETF
jgi:hypothetical protein